MGESTTTKKKPIDPSGGLGTAEFLNFCKLSQTEVVQLVNGTDEERQKARVLLFRSHL